MNNDIYKFLSENGFSKCAEIKFDTTLYFEVDKHIDQERRGFVYVWLINCDGKLNFAYVGETGKKMSDRFKDHLRGFKNLHKGNFATMKKILADQLNSGCRIEVHSRNSERKSIFGIETSLHLAEESALIKWMELNHVTLLNKKGSKSHP
ncbi:MAG: hypothetical protein NVS9B10_22370 [Nevskia sp.]